MLHVGFVSALVDMHSEWREEDMARLDASKFTDTFCAYLAVTTHATGLGDEGLGLSGFDQGPFADCPICCDLTSGMRTG